MWANHWMSLFFRFQNLANNYMPELVWASQVFQNSQVKFEEHDPNTFIKEVDSLKTFLSKYQVITDKEKLMKFKFDYTITPNLDRYNDILNKLEIDLQSIREQRKKV